MLYAPACKNLTLPIVLNPPLPGRFVGRMLLRPILTDENGASNKYVFALSGRLEGVFDTPLQGTSKKGHSFPFRGYFCSD